MDTPNGSDWGSRSYIRVLALIAVTALGLYVCYLMTLPFLPALTWALALAVFFMPVHQWLESIVKRQNLAASVSVLGIGLIVIVPAAFMGQRLVSDAVRGADTIRTKVEFMAIVGGVIVFGASGLILGPVILTVTVVLLAIWRSRTP
jgi:predicted PurR-regulated permease PerM